MNRYIRYFSIVSAVVIFFIMTFAGLLQGTRSEIICVRALKGAGIAYVCAMLAIRAIFSILIHEMASDEAEKEKQEVVDGS